MKKISQDDIKKVLSEVMHPEINYNLVDLGMIDDVVIKENKASLTLKLPFLEVPIKDYLIQIIKESLISLHEDLELEVKLDQMSQQERDKFMKKAKEGWEL
jgi:ATP-binding protein involved in chromosome partitioning